MAHSDIDAFPCLPEIKSKNLSKTYHNIGKWVHARPILINRADIHSMGNDSAWIIAKTESIEYKSRNKFYHLYQNTLFLHLFQKFGPKEVTTSEYTVDDYVCVMGVAFNDHTIREYLPDMIGKTKGGNRSDVDGSRPGMRAGFRLLFHRFVDDEVHFLLLPEWGSAESIAQIDSICGLGTFQQHGTFNPNNLQRIGLPWDKPTMRALFLHVMNLYNKCIEKCGSGYPENFNDWQARDPEWVMS